MTVAIVKYNAGNVQSVLCALGRLGQEPLYTDDPDELRRADKVIFPGVGEAQSAMTYLRARGLDQVLKHLTQPVLGICLGLALLCEHSEERDTNCLGVFPERVRRFPRTGKVPHVGWNSLSDLRSPLFSGLEPGAFVYFVHSFYAELGDNCAAQCDYLVPFAASLQRDNFYAVQFHPEKSGSVGSQIISNFLERCD